MENVPPDWSAQLLEWLRHRLADSPERSPAQGLLWTSAPYNEDAPALRDRAEFDGAIEHLEFAIHKRFANQLTRAERARLENTIENALFKARRYAERLDEQTAIDANARLAPLIEAVRAGRERIDRQRRQARRAELKLAQLTTLSPDGFEEFVAELFESLGFEVDPTGGSGDEGIDMRVRKDAMVAIVQCKFHHKGVVGSPELQRFLGSIHHARSHKGFFVTTSTFTLSAEKFAADNPIELIDGPRLVELIHEVMGSMRKVRGPSLIGDD